jgi:hypothetical protein
MHISNISSDEKIDLNQIVSEFIQYVNEDSPQDLTTNPNVRRVRVIKADSG